MGGSNYSSSVFDDTYAKATAGGASYFAHTSAIQRGTAKAAVHELLDPSKPNKAGQLIRESRDSTEHPESNAIGVACDVTGSMMGVPPRLVAKLGALMATLTKKDYIKDPQILFGGIGDAYGDSAPLQVGQFESGNEMDEAIGKLYLEGGGGGQTGQHESYELFMYYMARHTALDCFEKRGKKGVLFIIGDEVPYDKVAATQVKLLIGDDIKEDISTKLILKELRERFDVYWLYPKEGSYFDDKKVMDPLRKMFGENLITLENADEVCEVIAAVIGIREGLDVKAIEANLISLGSSKAAAKAVLSAVSP